MTEHLQAEVARAVHQVFSDPAYVDEPRSFEVHEGLLRFIAKLNRLYEEIIAWFLRLIAGQGTWLSYLLAVAVAIGIVFLLVRLARLLGRGARFDVPVGAQLEQAGARASSSRELYASAHALARAGDWPDALRHLVLALAAHLRGDRQLRWSDSWTNHELASRVVLPDEKHAELDRLVGAVDRAWYGRGSATQAEFEEGCALLARVAGFPEAGP